MPNTRLVVDRFHMAKQFNEVVDELRKKITREYKAPLPKAQQKRFRSLMWEFRRDPKDLKPGEREALDRLFVALPRLKEVYEVRVRFKEIFDTAPHRATAEQQPAELRLRTESLGLDFRKFWTTYDNGNVGILNYFDGRYTSAAVEGINNKAWVITKRCYGVNKRSYGWKSPGTLWHRLILDLNRASEAVGRSIAELREIVSGLKAVFLAFGTENRKSPRSLLPASRSVALFLERTRLHGVPSDGLAGAKLRMRRLLRVRAAETDLLAPAECGGHTHDSTPVGDRWSRAAAVLVRMAAVHWSCGNPVAR